MVITDIPFEKLTSLQKRYDLMRRSDEAPQFENKKDEEDVASHSLDYATFLREQEKESSRRRHTSNKRPGRLLVPAVHVPPTHRVTVAKMANTYEDIKSEHEQNMKVIEDHMWHQKQEERELKRIEGDIIKRQRAVRHTLRDFENALNKKKLEESKKLTTGLAKYGEMEQGELRRKEQLIHTRVSHALNEKLRENEFGHLMDVQKIQCMNEYQTKMAELELKRTEIDNLAHDFQAKMKLHEETEHALKKQIAELVLTINMNALKEHKHTHTHNTEKKLGEQARIGADLAAARLLENNLKQADTDITAADMLQRRLSAMFNQKKELISISKRDEQRRLTDTQKRLTDNSQTQRNIYDTSQNYDLDLQAKKMDHNVKEHTARRHNLMRKALQQRKEKQQQKQEALNAKFHKRINEQRAQIYEDSHRHFLREVSRNENTEHTLYQQMRSAEYTHRQQDQTVQRLISELGDMKRKNSILLKEMAVKIQREEKQLDQLIQREAAAADKTHSEREEKYHKLQKLRVGLRNDQYLLREHDRENLRARRLANTIT